MRVDVPDGVPSRRVRHVGLRGEVYEAILELVIEGRIGEGAALRAEALATMLEVSPTPVREALVQLESTGLVTYAANKGYRVAPRPSRDEIVQIIDARAVLEEAAASRAAACADDDLVRVLRDILADQDQAAKAIGLEPGRARDESLRRYLLIDHAFHDAIFRGSHNRYIERLAATMDAQAQRARQTFHSGVSDAVEALAEHGLIVDAIAARDERAAGAAMRKHLDQVLARALVEPE